MQAADAGRAITRLQELVNSGPGENTEALHEALAILVSLGSSAATGYQSEKLAATKGSFETWLGIREWQAFGEDHKIFRAQLLLDIEKLRKALARGASGQD